jgi:DNA-binding transcriptional LysR family regulator
VSAFPTAAASILPSAVALFSERHPDVELSFIQAEPGQAATMLRAAELEVAVVFEYRNLSQPEFDSLYEGVELHDLLDDPMYLALPRHHPLARRQRLRFEDLADETWIQDDTGGECGRLHQAACRSAGFEPHSLGFQSDDYNVVQGLIAAGVGVALLPALALTNVREDIVVRSLGRRAPSRRVAAATLAGRFRSPATEAMLGILDEVAGRFELPAGAAVAA